MCNGLIIWFTATWRSDPISHSSCHPFCSRGHFRLICRRNWNATQLIILSHKSMADARVATFSTATKDNGKGIQPQPANGSGEEQKQPAVLHSKSLALLISIESNKIRSRVFLLSLCVCQAIYLGSDLFWGICVSSCPALPACLANRHTDTVGDNMVATAGHMNQVAVVVVRQFLCLFKLRI